MQKKGLRQLLTVVSLFILLVLPTAIVGFTNFSSVVNKAFGKPFRQDSNTFIVLTESSENITTGAQFSLKVTATAPKALPLQYTAAFIEFDKNKVDVKSVLSQNSKQFTVIAFQNGYLLYPATMQTPTTIEDILPKTCTDKQLCNLADNTPATSVTFSVNGILLNDLAEQQRPIKITLIGAAETTSTIIWNEKVELPELKLGAYIKNFSPDFTSEPENYTKEGTAYSYDVTTKDTDNDPVLLSLECPEKVFCDKAQQAPPGLMLENNKLVWTAPVYRKDPYVITIYANDGKSVSTQTFQLFVLQKDTSYFTCTFTPAVAVKILDYSVETPLVIVADSTEKLTNATVLLKRNNQIEKTFDYAFQNPSKSIILDRNSSPSLAYQFNEGTYTGTAVFTSETGEKFTCELENPTVSLGSLIREAASLTVKQVMSTVSAATGLTVGVNNAPSFLTDPMLPAASGGSSPSVSFVYGPTYSFQLRAQDVDGDPLQHTIVAKPGWATVSVTSTNPPTGASTYSVQFTGVPQAKDAGSNLFSVSINDGYGHFITRTWVINIDYPDNDIPRVTLTKPTNFTLPSYCPSQTTTPVTLYQGQSFMMVFDATDRNQIVRFGLYYTKDLASTSRATYDANISYKMRCMAVNTTGIPPGDYYFILTATDSFTPPAVGSAYTNLVRILPPKPKPTPAPTTPVPTATVTTTVTTTPSVTPTPTATSSIVPTPNEMVIQITSPQQNAKMKPENFQFVATITGSTDAEVLKNNVVVKLDSVDITSKVNFSADKGKTVTLSYKSATLLDYAVHEIIVQAQDSKKKSSEAKVTFTVINEDATDSNSVNFFGINIRKDLYTIFMAALILIGILVLLPLIMYFAFRNSEKDKSGMTAKKPLTPSQPFATPPQLRTPTNSFATPTTQYTTTQQTAVQRPPAPPTYVSQPPTFGPSQQTQPPRVTPTSIPVSPTFSQQAKPQPIITQQQPVKQSPPIPVPVTTQSPVQQPTKVVTQSQPAHITPKQALDNFIAQSTDSKPVQQKVATPPAVQPTQPKPQVPSAAQPIPMQQTAKPMQQTMPPTNTPKATNIPNPAKTSVQTPQTVPGTTVTTNKQPTNIPNVVTPKADTQVAPGKPSMTLPPESPSLP